MKTNKINRLVTKQAKNSCHSEGEVRAAPSRAAELAVTQYSVFSQEFHRASPQNPGNILGTAIPNYFLFASM